MKEIEIKINSGHYPEALDRAHTIMLMLGELLEEHPVVKKHDNIRQAYETAQHAAWELYQAIGNLDETFA